MKIENIKMEYNNIRSDKDGGEAKHLLFFFSLLSAPQV